MELPESAFASQSKGKVGVGPILTNPVTHEQACPQRCRNRQTLEVFRLARCVLGEHGDGDVVSGQTSKTAKNEVGQHAVVNGCAKA